MSKNYQINRMLQRASRASRLLLENVGEERRSRDFDLTKEELERLLTIVS